MISKLANRLVGLRISLNSEVLHTGVIVLPLRSMVGQLPLEQHIGVRIPEGQPYRPFKGLT